MIRFSTAMMLFGALGAMGWATLSDERIRLGSLLVLGMFALRTWVHRQRQIREQRESEEQSSPM